MLRIQNPFNSLSMCRVHVTLLLLTNLWDGCSNYTPLQMRKLGWGEVILNRLCSQAVAGLGFECRQAACRAHGHTPARSGHEQWVQNRNSSRWQPCPTTVNDPHELLPPCPSPQPADPESHPPGRHDLSPGPLCQHPLLQCLFCPLHFDHLVLDRFLLQLWSWPWTRTDRLIFTSGSRTEEGGGEWNAYSILRHLPEILHTHLYTHLFCCQNLTTHWPEFNYKASGYLPGNLENTVYSRRPSTWIKWEFQVWGLPICATLILVWRNKYTCDSFYLEDWTSGMKTKRIKMAVGECALVWIKPISNQSHKNPRWKCIRLPCWVQNLVLAWFYLPLSIVCRIVCPWLDVMLEKISAV